MFYIFLDDAGLYQGFTEVHTRTSCELWQAGAHTHTPGHGVHVFSVGIWLFDMHAQKCLFLDLLDL